MRVTSHPLCRCYRWRGLRRGGQVQQAGEVRQTGRPRESAEQKRQLEVQEVSNTMFDAQCWFLLTDEQRSGGPGGENWGQNSEASKVNPGKQNQL